MMPIDHIAAGILVPHLSGRNPTAQVFGVSLIASILPDVQVAMSGWKGSIDYLSHRAASHSFFLAPVLALVPVALVLLFLRGRSEATFLHLYLISLASYSIHILLDLITPFGTQILYPLSRKQYSLDLLHSFDPLFMVISAVVICAFIFAMKNKAALTSQALIPILLLYLIYIGFALVQKRTQGLAFRAKMESVDIGSEYLTTVPRTFWRWKGIAKNDSGYSVAVRNRGSIDVKNYDDSPSAPPLVAQTIEVMKYQDYARFAIVEHATTTVEIHNLVYSPDSYRLIIDVTANRMPAGFTLTGFDLADKRF